MTDEEVAAAALSDLAPRETRRWSFVGSGTSGVAGRRRADHDV